MQKIKETLTPSIIASLTAVGLYKFWLGEDLSDTVPILGMDMPAYATVGISSLSGALVGEVLQDVIKPHVSGMLGSMEGMILPPVVNGLSTYGAIALLVNKDASFLNSFGLGAGSNIIGHYASKSLGY